MVYYREILEDYGGSSNYDNVAGCDFFLNFDISGRRLRLHRISLMAHSVSDLLAQCLGHFPTSHIKIIRIKNCINFFKNCLVH